jgi:cytoskeletal protein CcmA (bactofilin family)
MKKDDHKDKKLNPGEKFQQKSSGLGSTLILKGELSGEEDVVIEGNFQGKINLGNHNLVIEKGGKVEAEIFVKNITLNGHVIGNIYASEKVFISPDGQMEGDIHASRISIMDGAQFKGSIKMESIPEPFLFKKDGGK